jgi:hypothetical protein
MRTIRYCLILCVAACGTSFCEEISLLEALIAKVNNEQTQSANKIIELVNKKKPPAGAAAMKEIAAVGMLGWAVEEKGSLTPQGREKIIQLSKFIDILRSDKKLLLDSVQEFKVDKDDESQKRNIIEGLEKLFKHYEDIVSKK